MEVRRLERPIKAMAEHGRDRNRIAMAWNGLATS